MGFISHIHVHTNRAYLSNTPTNLCIALYCIPLYCVVLDCIVLLIYCYVDIVQYNAMHKFVGVLDNPPIEIPFLVRQVLHDRTRERKRARKFV